MATITVKNIPDELYGRLKRQAQANRRSINSELLRCLEDALLPRRIPPEEQLRRVRQVRPQVDPEAVDPEELLEAIDKGRP